MSRRLYRFVINTTTGDLRLFKHGPGRPRAYKERVTLDTFRALERNSLSMRIDEPYRNIDGHTLHATWFELPPTQIESVGDLADIIGIPGADQAAIAKAIYKGSCGIRIIFAEDGVTVGSIIEGADFDTQYYTLTYPFTPRQFWGTLQAVEDEADYIWRQTHGCERCEADGFVGEWGHVAINPNCPECKGQGAII